MNSYRLSTNLAARFYSDERVQSKARAKQSRICHAGRSPTRIVVDCGLGFLFTLAELSRDERPFPEESIWLLIAS